MKRSIVLVLLAIGIAGCGDSGSNQSEQDLSTARAELATTRQKVADERAELQRLERQVGRKKKAIAKNTIAGTGTFVVGTDITPGTYHAEAQHGCYWARLSSFTTSDIIDNDNADGPTTVQIMPSDKAFTTSGCADFHKVG